MPKKTNRIGVLLLVFLLSVIVFRIQPFAEVELLREISDEASELKPLSQETSSNSFSNKLASKTPSELDRSELSEVAENQAVPILYYHSVMREVGNEVRMPPDQFEAQMTFLKDQGFHSVSLNQLYQAEYCRGPLPSKPFVITFDDGYVDNYTTAFPIIKRNGFIATVFMVSSYINGEGFMSWSQLKELASNGWEIEGHSATHPYLSTLDADTLANEINSPKKLLEKELGRSVDFFAYPYGDFNDNVVLAVKNAGYLMAFTTERGWADCQVDAWHVHRVYCFANMGIKEFMRRLQHPNY